jgi:hypothetical protein
MLGWSSVFFFFWVYRTLLSIVGQILVVQLTTLGDSARYQGNPEKFVGLTRELFLDSTTLVEGIGWLFSVSMSKQPILINIAFQSLAFYGIIRLLLAIELPLRRVFLVICLLPSFNLWTSVAGKEAVTVFSLGVLCSLFVEYYSNRARLGVIHLIAAFIMGVMKPHYFAGLMFLFATTWLSKRVLQKEALVLITGLSSLIVLVVFSQKVDDLSFEVQSHFPYEKARSTRELFWTQPYDVFWKAGEGMYLSFTGPTLDEALRQPLHMISFIESAMLVGLLCGMLMWRFARIPIYSFLIGFFTLFWTLFSNYPFGVMNPGSAVRYRSGYLLLVITVFVFVLSRRAFVSWQAGYVTGLPRRRRLRILWRRSAN